MYDFILLENYHLAINHLKDIVIIAKILRKAGYSVAIVRIYPDQCYEICEGIDYIDLDVHATIPCDNYAIHPKSKINSFFSMLRFLWQQHRYIEKALKLIEGKARNYYYGSYHLLMPISLLNKTTPHCYYFTWGLRSSRISSFKETFKSNPLLALRMIILRTIYQNKGNLKFFVSDSFIKKEFLSLGFADDKLIIRPERMLDTMPDCAYDELSASFSLLTIGSLRAAKRIEMNILEIKEVDGSWEYVIAGKARDNKYAKIIEEYIDNDIRCKRIDRRLNELEYNMLIKRTHFVLLNDCKQSSIITNGTLVEALMHFRPVIVPNYLPYSYFISEYKVGVMFDPSIKGSLKMAVEKARELGCDSFKSNIQNFLCTILVDNVSRQFSLELKNKCERIYW